MALRTIKTRENPVLRKKSRAVEEYNDRLCELLDDMKETLYKQEGVGLAAVQIGVLKRVVVIDCSSDGSGYMELVNPTIVEQRGEQKNSEGCLSIPNLHGITVRPAHVKVRAFDRTGKQYEITTDEPLLARCLCHEIDHLDGILYVDRLAKGEELHNDEIEDN